MKISEILEGRIPRKYWQPHANEASQLPSAPSLNDGPGDVDSNEDEVDEVDDTQDIESFKSVAGDIGDDLYSAIAFKISDDFDDVRLVNTVVSAIQDVDGTENYLAQNTRWVADNKIVPVVILNATTGEVIEFYSGVDTNEFVGKFSNMTPGQRNKLQSIKSAGRAYSNLVSNTDWVAGESPSDEDVYDALDDLKDSLSLNEIVDKVKRVRVSAEQQKRNDAYDAGADERIQAFLASKRKEKQNSAGRDKR
jgi:hypothetical protein